jgi:D-3-phosphoglycerate dehydrogenase
VREAQWRHEHCDLDDYQDAVRKLHCAAKLEAYPAKVYTNTVKGIGPAVRTPARRRRHRPDPGRTHMTRALIEKLPRLKLIAQTGRVGPHIDLDACTERGVAVTDGVGSPIAPAELTWALIMASMRRLPQYIATLKHGGWQQSGMRSALMPPNFGLGMVLRGKTLGVWGYGKIGQLVAGYGRAFGMRVLVWARQASSEKALSDGHEVALSREQLFEQSDVLSLHLRLNEETAGIVRLTDLGRMKPTALLVNTSRAELIEPDALIAGLNRGRPGMAAVDVFESEPILQGHALLRLENCVCTPHIGYVEQDSYEMYFGAAFDNVVNSSRVRPPTWSIPPPCRSAAKGRPRALRPQGGAARRTDKRRKQAHRVTHGQHLQNRRPSPAPGRWDVASRRLRRKPAAPCASTTASPLPWSAP